MAVIFQDGPWDGMTLEFPHCPSTIELEFDDILCTVKATGETVFGGELEPPAKYRYYHWCEENEQGEPVQWYSLDDPNDI